MIENWVLVIEIRKTTEKDSLSLSMSDHHNDFDNPNDLFHWMNEWILKEENKMSCIIGFIFYAILIIQKSEFHQIQP